MNPELIFLGTGGDCLSISKRSSAGLLLKTENSLIHIDPGPGALLGLVRAGFDPKKLSSILTSEDSFVRNHDVAALKWAATMGGLESKDLDSKTFRDIKMKIIPIKKYTAFFFRSSAGKSFKERKI